MREIKEIKTEQSPTIELTIKVMGKDMLSDFDKLVFSDNEKATYIKGAMILGLSLMMDGIDKDNEYFKNLDYSKITTLRKFIEVMLTNAKKDYKKGKPINDKRKQDLHNFAINSNISREKENELISEVDNLSIVDLEKAKSYGFWGMKNYEELRKDHPTEIYFYQYACCRWLEYILIRDINDITKSLETIKTLSDNELKACNKFIKTYLLNYVKNIKETDLSTELYNILENREK